MANPLDAVRKSVSAFNALDQDRIESRKKHAAARAAQDLELWNKWNESGRKPEHLEPLLNRYENLFNRKVQEWSPPMIEREAMKADITKNAIKAFQTYNPDKAALNTHVQNYIQKSKRFMVQHQNVAYIPEQQAYSIGDIQRAQSSLNEDLGRDPTPSEIADHLGMKVKDVVKIQKSIRKDIAGSSLESDPMPHLGSRQQEVLAILPSVLTPEEKQVFDYMYHPDPKKRIMSTSVIARKMGKNDSQVSRLKTSIIGKAKKYM